MVSPFAMSCTCRIVPICPNCACSCLHFAYQFAALIPIVLPGEHSKRSPHGALAPQAPASPCMSCLRGDLLGHAASRTDGTNHVAWGRLTGKTRREVAPAIWLTKAIEFLKMAHHIHAILHWPYTAWIRGSTQIAFKGHYTRRQIYSRQTGFQLRDKRTLRPQRVCWSTVRRWPCYPWLWSPSKCVAVIHCTMLCLISRSVAHQIISITVLWPLGRSSKRRFGFGFALLVLFQPRATRRSLGCLGFGVFFLHDFTSVVGFFVSSPPIHRLVPLVKPVLGPIINVSGRGTWTGDQQRHRSSCFAPGSSTPWRSFVRSGPGNATWLPREVKWPIVRTLL